MYERNKSNNQLNQIDLNTHDIENYLDAVFNITGDPIFIKDEECRLLLVNDAFCNIFGLARNQIIGKTLAEEVTPSEREHFLAIDRKVLQEGKEITCEETLTTNGAKTKTILTKKNRFLAPNGKPFIVGVIHDITERKQSELREKSHTHILELITSGKELPDILIAIVKVVEAENPKMMCSVLLLDESGRHLLHGASTSLPEFYCKAIEGEEIGISAGSCGTAAYKNERVIVSDINTHPYWAQYKDLANKAGLGSCWSEPIRSSKGTVLGTFAIYHRDINYPTDADLTIIEQAASLASIAIEKKQAEEKIKRAASVFTHANEGIMITDANASIIEVNDTFCKITGYSHEEVLGKNPRILQSNEHSSDFYSTMWSTIFNQGHWRGEIWNRRKNGEIYPEMLTISAVKNALGEIQHYVSLSTDISDLKANQGQLERIAHYDLLTNLPNRVLLADRLNQAMVQCQRHNKSLGVAFMDLDSFKAINDTYGHSVGDELLIAVSQRMKDALREGDTLARIGGDEFIAVMVDLEKFEDTELIISRLLKAAASPITVSTRLMQVSASIGVTLYPQDGVDAEQLMRHADQAMYIAKQAGKNTYHLFDTAQDTAINTQRKSIDNIRTAIQKQEFVLHFQPKVNMRTGEVTGFEALIRWHHPINGIIPPLEFLPIIEGHEVSLRLGEWVIKTALDQIIEWRKVGINLPISVNISAHQLQQDNFTSRLATILGDYSEVEPNCLELEILETSALQDTKQVSSTMSACQELGVKFAIDDFGTGYSSLTYLKRLPAYLIKIDQSFVRDMLEDTDDLAIVEGVVGLAKAFRRTVIAEGVETVAHGEALLKLGCELAQGYGIARPMASVEIPAWVKSWKADDAWLQHNKIN
ncbi:bifunctional diguanylate cyclase/phosphodiesterase [Aliiglaciecola lipolytica]|uniref:Sensory box/GGDEF/GAF/EAL domain protein n=1 Tax=Aliiglaciecola lipolytica E3 TaxID=1127673 RepID=K6WX92_9ALTE|nr:EAL domain-containing protein [Aliiglaciecola lipolytica]GAC13074.1 sensory box/GGDEF/GAF/EAL domain protein [Aliiglaciecola lipolytica E3]